MDPSTSVPAETPLTTAIAAEPITPLPYVPFPAQTNTTVDSLNSARKKHEERAKRFGVEFVEPKIKVVDVHAPKRYMNPKHSGFVTGFALDDEAEKQKRNMRARKFAVQADNNTTADESSATTGGVEEDQMDAGMDVDIREERKDVGLNVQRRLDTIYLYGTDTMSTEDIFGYFKEYGPACVEWINDSSCNVIFLDVHTTTRALQGTSKPLDELNLLITGDAGLISAAPPKPSAATDQPSDPSSAALPTETITSTTDPASASTSSAAPTTAVQATPEQITLYGWRRGKTVKGVPMLMRYATIEDVKSKEHKPSAYYKTMLSDLRSQKTNKNRNKRNRQRGGRNRDKERDLNDNGNTKGKRKIDDDGDMEMLDPAELEKRKQRRRRFFPEENNGTNNESNETNYIVSSSTVPALLQPSPAPPPASAEPVPQASTTV